MSRMSRFLTISLGAALLMSAALPSLAANGCPITFKPKNLAIGTNPQTILTDDFNRDGIADLVTGNDTSFSVSVLIGNGDGTFQTHQDYSTGRYPHGVALGDFNNDHAPDIAAVNEG